MERGECYEHRDRADCGWCHEADELEARDAKLAEQRATIEQLQTQLAGEDSLRREAEDRLADAEADKALWAENYTDAKTRANAKLYECQQLKDRLAEAERVAERLMVYAIMHEQQNPEWNGNRFDDLAKARAFLKPAGEPLWPYDHPDAPTPDPEEAFPKSAPEGGDAGRVECLQDWNEPTGDASEAPAACAPDPDDAIMVIPRKRKKLKIVCTTCGVLWADGHACGPHIDAAPQCPKCGYTKEDQRIHGDHHLCDGEIPKPTGDGSEAPAACEHGVTNINETICAHGCHDAKPAGDGSEAPAACEHEWGQRHMEWICVKCWTTGKPDGSEEGGDA